MQKGKLYLIPVTLGDNDTISKVLPYSVFEIIDKLNFFIVEKTRTARRFISVAINNKSIDEIHFFELDKHSKNQDIKAFLNPLFQGFSIGLMSEAGTPAIADPGSQIISLAHMLNIEVVPLVGPNSLLLALMASGFNGQNFVFHGYLPKEKENRVKKLKKLETDILKKEQTQIFIETPYRNSQLFESILKTCKAQTKLCLACDITLSSQWIKTKTVANWKKETVNLRKKLTVFLLFH